MYKYNGETPKIVYDLIANKGFSKRDVALHLGITVNTFNKWIDPLNTSNFKEVLYDFYTEAMEMVRLEKIKELEISTKKMIDGYYVEEEKIINNANGSSTTQTTKRWIAGSPQVLIHEKKSIDFERWGDKASNTTHIKHNFDLDSIENKEVLHTYSKILIEKLEEMDNKKDE